MKAQTPAEGILQTHDWGDSKVYKVICDCGQPDHEHNVWVEADECGINVNIYVTVKSNFWSKTRWHHIWQLLTKGYIDLETNVSMTQQTAHNYATKLESAITDVKEFKKPKGGQQS
jgi:hypothetical protein